MAERSLVNKLQIKNSFRMVIVNAPPEYLQLLGELPTGSRLLTKVESPLDFGQIFVKTVQELEMQVPSILKALKEDGLFWICYPKGGSKIKTDLKRDILWAKMKKFGLAAVSLISVDSTWSAMRFRPANKIGKRQPEGET